MIQEAIGVDEAVIENVVRTFYGRVLKDDLIGPIFDERIKDWEPHLQNMFAFWSSVILHTRRYNGRPMPKHVTLPVEGAHFDCWLKIWGETVDDICGAEDAALFKYKAQHIAKSLEMGVAHYNGVFLKSDERLRCKHGDEGYYAE